MDDNRPLAPDATTTVEKRIMHFSDEERQAMLKLKGVGATVIRRLEQIEYSSLAALRDRDAAGVTKEISEMMGSTCWHNRSQARSAIQAVTDLAKGDIFNQRGILLRFSFVEGN